MKHRVKDIKTQVIKGCGEVQLNNQGNKKPSVLALCQRHLIHSLTNIRAQHLWKRISSAWKE